MTIALWVAGALAALLFVGWLGLQVPPAPFPDYPGQVAASSSTVPLPSGLPAPVERYYRLHYGDSVPVVDSVVVTGRGRIRPMGVWFPARYRFTHDAGRGYRHYIEATWFGLPFMKVNERYVDGESLIEIPVVGTDSGPKVEQAANLGMWAELSAAAPSVLVTDPRVRWLPIDERTAALVVPFGDGETDSFTARFDPATGDLATLEAMRYRDSSSSAKVLWIARTEPGGTLTEARLGSVGSATWLDMGSPWAYFTTEDLRYDVDVDTYVRAKGL